MEGFVFICGAMTKKIKVCFIVGTLGRGGAERQLLFMLRALKNCGISAKVLCLTKGESYEQEIRSLGVPVDWIGESENRGLRLLEIIKNLRKDRADILQSSHFYTNIYAGLAGKILKIPSIGAIRSDLHSELKFHGFLGAYQISLPAFLIANSELAHRRAIENGRSFEKIEFVRNVVEAETCGSKTDANSSVKILFVGRLDKNKHPERFVELAAILIEKFPKLDLQFQIAGDGVLRKELETMAQKLNLSSEKLKFLGVCSDMNEVYKQADMLISTSEREGTSNVILEAMAYGLPIVATNVGGTPDILKEDRGILVEPGDEDELVKATAELISDDKLRSRLGTNGRKYVEENHSLESLEQQLTHIYTNLISKK
jgi:L-malate glycosyltransferase